MNLKNIINIILKEQQIPKGTKSSQLVKSITNRHPVTFFYSGPKNGKDSVKSGVRIRGEAVAMGLSKGGNVIIRTYVEPPSVSKKGFSKTNWRTFRLDRMSNIQILTDETFDTQRPGYKEGAESSNGPMITTYVTTDWDIKQVTREPEQPTQTEPTTQQTDTSLTQPQIDDKPDPTPQETQKDFASDVFKSIQPKDVNGIKVITTQEFEDGVDKVYMAKEQDWVRQQTQINKNTKPGEGTRRRFEMSSKSELSNLLNRNSIKVSDVQPIQEPEDNQIQESIRRIKSLMLL